MPCRARNARNKPNSAADGGLSFIAKILLPQNKRISIGGNRCHTVRSRHDLTDNRRANRRGLTRHVVASVVMPRQNRRQMSD